MALDDDKGRGRKPRIVSDVITSIRDEFDIDRRSALATMVYVSILTEYLNMSNVHVPHILRDSEKERRVRDSNSFFKTLWKGMRTKYEAIRVPIEHYRHHKDKSPPHMAASTMLELDILSCGRVDHLPYSPYLAPFDFDVYPKVNSQLKSRRFPSYPELRSATANIISQYNQDWSRVIYWRILREKWQVVIDVPSSINRRYWCR